MSKFKVGDRVRCVKDFVEGAAWDVRVGTEGKVRHVKGGDIAVEWDGWNDFWWYGLDHLELIDPAPVPAIDAHYTKYAIQPMEFSLANGLDPAQHTVVKYAVRYRDKGGVRDLRAAIRVLELMIEREERKASDNG